MAFDRKTLITKALSRMALNQTTFEGMINRKRFSKTAINIKTLGRMAQSKMQYKV
jgi:hypothetical protein